MEITDPNILAELDAISPHQQKSGEITDPALLSRINAASVQEKEGISEDTIKSLISGVAEGAITAPAFLGDAANLGVQGIQKAYEYYRDISNQPMTQEQEKRLEAIKPFFSSQEIEQKAGELTQMHPFHEPSTILGKGANLLGSIYGGGALAAGPKNIAKYALSKTPLAAKVPLTEAANLDILGKASTGAAKNPKSLESGLKANKAISQEFGKRLDVSDELYGKAEKIGAGKITDVSDIKQPLDSLVQDLEKRPFLTASQQTALAKLKKTQEKLSSPQQVSLFDANGNIIKGKMDNVIDLNEIASMKKALNKSYASSDPAIGNFLGVVKNKITSLKDVHPDFVNALGEADTHWAKNVAPIYLDNAEMKSIWHPDDLSEWTKKIKDPDYALHPETLSRASETLSHLNTEKVGRISSVIQSLPPEQAESVLRDAVSHATQNTPSLWGAGKTLLSGSPVKAAKEAISATVSPQTAPISKLAEQLPSAAPIISDGALAATLTHPFVKALTPPPLPDTNTQ